MKSSLIELDMDLSLDIEGQKWNQGDTIRGCLLLKNKSKNTIDPQVFKLIFIYADIKKFKNISESAYKEFFSLELKKQKLVSNEEVKIPWEVKLDTNAPVACKKYAPYVLWGSLGKRAPASLMINIFPHVTIEKIIVFFLSDNVRLIFKRLCPISTSFKTPLLLAKVLRDTLVVHSPNLASLSCPMLRNF